MIPNLIPNQGVEEPQTRAVNVVEHAADARMECRICWSLYDPVEGDPAGEIPPGTAFAELPNDWRCPRCDSGKSYFLPIP